MATGADSGQPFRAADTPLCSSCGHDLAAHRSVLRGESGSVRLLCFAQLGGDRCFNHRGACRPGAEAA